MVKASMTTIEDFESDSERTRYLASQLVNGRLVLVLGTGLSIPFGLPNWEELVNGLFALKDESVPTEGSFEDLAEYFRNKFYRNDYSGYLKAVNEVLYEKVDIAFDTFRKNNVISAIGSLVMSSRRGSISRVITFNFDNLLETYLKYHGYVTKSVYEYPYWDGYSDVTIYHPHGMIPFDMNEEHSKKIILDQMSYSSAVGKEEDPCRQQVQTIMRGNTCLFIGLSGQDVNLDSLLISVSNTHAIPLENTVCWGIAFGTEDSDLKYEKWLARGIYYKKIADYEEGLSNMLFSICQEASKIA